MKTGMMTVERDHGPRIKPTKISRSALIAVVAQVLLTIIAERMRLERIGVLRAGQRRRRPHITEIKMHKILKGGVAFAAMMTMGASFAAAQMATEGMYLNKEQNGEMRIYGPNNTTGTAVLMNENGKAPGTCPEGSFYETSDNFIRACGTDEQFGFAAAAEGMPAGAMSLSATGEAMGSDTDAADTESPTSPNTADEGESATGNGNTSNAGNGSTDNGNSTDSSNKGNSTDGGAQQ